MSREGVRLSCNQEIPADSLAVSELHIIAAATGQLTERPAAHDDLAHKILRLAAWGQVAGMAFGPLAVLACGWWWVRRRRRGKAG